MANVIKATTLRSKFIEGQKTLSSGRVFEALKNLGITPETQSKEHVLGQYEGYAVEIEGQEEQPILTADNFDEIVSTETDRLNAQAMLILAEYRDQAEPLLTALSELYDEIDAKLKSISDKLSMPELKGYEATVSRSGGGGGAKEERDWSKGEWTKPGTGKAAGAILRSNVGPSENEPSSFTAIAPDGTVLGTEYPSSTAAAKAVAESVGQSGAVNGPRYFRVPFKQEDNVEGVVKTVVAD